MGNWEWGGILPKDSAGDYNQPMRPTLITSSYYYATLVPGRRRSRQRN